MSFGLQRVKHNEKVRKEYKDIKQRERKQAIVVYE
jgi:hypothetical protein